MATRRTQLARRVPIPALLLLVVPTTRNAVDRLSTHPELILRKECVGQGQSQCPQICSTKLDGWIPLAQEADVDKLSLNAKSRSLVAAPVRIG